MVKIEIKKLDATKREMKFEVPKERVHKILNEVYEDIGKVAKIKGYRPGKAPRHLLESQHGELAREETLKKVIPEVYREGLEKEKLSPLDLPDIEDVEFKDGVVKFVAKLDIKPEINVKEYKGIRVKRKDAAVTEEELNKTLEFFQKSHNQAGKEAPVDDAFARGLGYPNLQDFKNSLKRQLEIDKDRNNRFDVENQIVEALIKQVKLAAPESLVKKQLAHRLEETKRRFLSQNGKEEDFKKREEELTKELRPIVEKDIKAYLIFDKIAQLEQMTVPDGESLPAKVMEYLLKEAKWE